MRLGLNMREIDETEFFDSQLLEISIDSVAQENIDLQFFLTTHELVTVQAINPVLIQIQRTPFDDGAYLVGEIHFKELTLDDKDRLKEIFPRGHLGMISHSGLTKFWWLSLDGGITMDIVCESLNCSEKVPYPE